MQCKFSMQFSRKRVREREAEIIKEECEIISSDRTHKQPLFKFVSGDGWNAAHVVNELWCIIFFSRIEQWTDIILVFMWDFFHGINLCIR